MTQPAIYFDLINEDGTLNRAAFEEILARKVLTETNMRLCLEAKMRAPRSVPLGLTHAWYADCVKANKLGPLPEGERNRITNQQRVALNDLAATMQRKAAEQREAMGAFLTAAE